MSSIHRTALLAVLAYLLFSAPPMIAQASCTLSSTNQTVTICTPANGATVGTTFHVNAGTTDTLGIQYIEVYVAYKRYALQHQNYLDADITVPAGTHLNMTVQAIDTSGVWMYKTYYINVSSATYAISPLAPTVSEGATVQ